MLPNTKTDCITNCNEVRSDWRRASTGFHYAANFDVMHGWKQRSSWEQIQSSPEETSMLWARFASMWIQDSIFRSPVPFGECLNKLFPDCHAKNYDNDFWNSIILEEIVWLRTWVLEKHMVMFNNVHIGQPGEQILRNYVLDFQYVVLQSPSRGDSHLICCWSKEGNSVTISN